MTMASSDPNSQKAQDPAASPTKPNPVDLAHYVMYGQPGHPPEKRVLPTDWSDIDTFRSPVTSTWALPKPLSPAQMTRLLDGFQPRQMEDKWFVYSDGPDEEGVVRVNFYRSWTSFKLAQMEIKLFSEGEGGGWVTGLIWESHPDKVNGQDAAGAKEMVAGVCRWVLGVELPLPVEVEAAEARGERAEEEVDGQGE